MEDETANAAGEADAVNLLDPMAVWAAYQDVIISGALKVVGALLVIIIGLRVAGWLAGFVRRQAEKRESVDKTLASFFASVVRWAVTALNASSVDITTRSWTSAADYWAVKFDLTKKAKSAFDAQGISIPYPHTAIVQKAG